MTCPNTTLSPKRPATRTTHFRMSEFSSPGVPKANGRHTARVPVPAKLHSNAVALMRELEIIRTALGGASVRIISGYRTLAYNKLNKGRASKSLHLQAKAADIVVRDKEGKKIRPQRVYWVIKDLMNAGAITKGGLAAYPSFVHYDIRGRVARWRKAPSRPVRGLGAAK